MATDLSQTIAKIEKQIKTYPILLYMKGTPEFPQCGFSSRAVQLLVECGFRFSYVNILENPDIRAALPQYANWPTFPQLYINGELVGGSDILMQLHSEGKLKPMLAAAADTATESA